MSTQAVAAPAVGVTFQVDLGNGTTMVLQTHYDQELSPQYRASLHDMLFADAERIKARVRVQAIDSEIAGVAKQASLSVPQIERAEADYNTKVAEITAASDASAQADADKHAESRRGEYKPSQQEKQRQVQFATQLQKLREERDTTLRNFDATNNMLKARVAELQAERDKMQAVVDAPFSTADR